MVILSATTQKCALELYMVENMERLIVVLPTLLIQVPGDEVKLVRLTLGAFTMLLRGATTTSSNSSCVRGWICADACVMVGTESIYPIVPL